MNDIKVAVSLEDDEAGQIASAIGNKTSRNILNFLTDKESTESEIASGLKLNLNTVEYNLKKLIKVGLIEKSKNFLWSSKGRRIEKYSVARRSIIISAREKKINTLPVIFAGIIGIFLIYTFIFSGNFFKVSDKPFQIKAGVPLPQIAEFVRSGQSVDLSEYKYPVWVWVLLGVWLSLVGFIVWNLRKR